MRLAHELGLPLNEVMNMAPDEFARWVAYFKMITPKDGRGGRSKEGSLRGSRTHRQVY
jgi:hypothetical protein